MTEQHKPEKKARPRGLGNVYLRNTTLWARYGYKGKCYRESADSPKRAVAINLLRVRHEQIGGGRFAPNAGGVGFEDLARLIVADYEANGRRSLATVKNCIVHLRATFGDVAAGEITCAELTRYVADRRREKAAAATIRKELMALRRMYTLAVRAGMLAQVPVFPPVEVRNVRQGFFEADELRTILQHLAPGYRPLIEFLALTGWRLGEAMGLTWRHVDMAAGVIRIERTKNDEPRTLPFRALRELAPLMEAQHEDTERIQRERGCIVGSVFHHADGRPLTYMHTEWERARKAAGLPGRLIHDLRRTAVRDLERAGVSRSVAMKLTGHKTESVYRRYAIVSEEDLAEGLEKVSDYRDRATMARNRRRRTGTEPAHSREAAH